MISDAAAPSLGDFYRDRLLPRLTADRVYDHPAHRWDRSRDKWRGACPWHASESGSSFNVTLGNLLWYCAGCGVGGGPIQYRARLRGQLDSPRGAEFVAILRELADLAGESFPDRELTPEERVAAEERASRQSALETVYRLCREALWSPAGEAARAYLNGRGLPDDAIRDLDLGLYPGLRDVRRQVARAGHKPDVNEGVWDKLEGYITFPWRDENGHALTLYGRWPATAAPEGRPKTIALPGDGSKASPLYFDRARRAGCTDVVLVEGLLDAAVAQALSQADVVAYVGGQPSRAQLETIRRCGVKSATICPDPDAGGDAGIRSFLKNVDPAIRTYVAPGLPDDQDPDEYILSRGVETWRAHLRAAVKGPIYLAQAILGAHDLTTAKGRDDARARLIEHAASLPDEQDRDDLAALAAGPLDTTAARLKKHVKEARRAAEAGAGGPNAATPRRLAEAIGAEDRFAQDGGGLLYVFVRGVYVPRGKPHVLRRVKALLEQWAMSDEWSSHLAGEVVEYIRVDAPELWERPPLGTVNLANGLLDIETRELRPHSPEFLSPVQLPVAYDKDATCPAWEAFIGQTFPDDGRDLAYEIPAWLMTPDTSIQKAVLLMGEGGNGKSVYLGGVASFLGQRSNVSSLSLHRLEADKFAAARLMGKLANICSDLPSEHLAGTTMFKSITGGDAITGERKYGDSFDFVPFARLLFSANHPPQSKDGSEGFFQRWLTVRLDRTFRGTSNEIRRADLDARLAAPRELSGLLNKALEALPRVRTSGLSVPESSRVAAEEFRAVTDPLAVWLDRETTQHPEMQVSRQGLLRAYNDDCKRGGRPPSTEQAFGRTIRRLRPDLREAQRTVAGKLSWVWLGLGLNGGYDPPSPPRGSHHSQDSQDSPYCFVPEKEELSGGREKYPSTGTNNRGNPVNPVNGVSSTHAPPPWRCCPCGSYERRHRPEWGDWVCSACGLSAPAPTGGAS